MPPRFRLELCRPLLRWWGRPMNRRRWENVCIALVCASVLAFFTWNVRVANGLQPTSGPTKKYDYYNHLVRGLLKGQLNLDVEVPAALRALADPYDPNQNRDVGLVDTTYYNGKYYMYFGIAPAVTLMLPWQVVVGHELPPGGAILIFVCVGYLAAAALWLALRRRYFPDSPWWTAPLGLGVFGLACMVGTVLRRPLFWEVAVAGGFAFSMLAIAATYRALHAERRRLLWTALAGLALGLAVASRPTYLFAGGLVLVPAWAAWRREGFSKETWRLAVAGGAAFSAIMLLLMAYNYARFDNPFETGHRYQLSVAYEAKVKQFSPGYFLYNLRNYYFLPAVWEWQPPFALPTPTPRSEWPPGFYTVDDVFGVLAVLPFAWLALVAPWGPRAAGAAVLRPFRDTVLALGVLYGCVGVLMLFFVASVARYQVDFVPSLILLAMTGLLVAEQRSRGAWGRWPVRIGVALLAFATAVGGALTTYELGRTVPATFPAATKPAIAAIQRLEPVFDRWSGKHYGPVEFKVRWSAARAAGTEVLLATGRAPREDRVLVEYRAGDELRFGVQHGEEPPLWGTVQKVAPDAESVVRIDLGSFYPEVDHVFFEHTRQAEIGAWRSRAYVSLDGRPVLDTATAFLAHGSGAPSAVARGFSGKVRGYTFISPRAMEASGAEANLALTFTRPEGGPGRRLPLLSSGRPGRSDLLLLELLDGDRARLGYDHSGATPLWSEPFALPPGTPQPLEVQPGLASWGRTGGDARALTVRVGGRTLWQVSVPAFAAATDEVFLGRNPNGHGTAEAAFPGLSSQSATAAPAAGTAGGIWHARVVLPRGREGRIEPLLGIGRAGSADMLMVVWNDDTEIELRLDHWGAPMVYSTRVHIEGEGVHDLEVFLPSFAPDKFGQGAEGEAWVKWNGRDVIRAKTVAAGFAPEEFRPGENAFGASMPARRFGGHFLSTEWVTSAR